MNVKSIFIALTVASIMTLGLPVRAADPVGPTRAEKSFDDCTINARLKFKDGKGGCVANHPAFFEQQNVHTLYKNPQFTHAVSLRPAQCPAVFGWTYNTAGGGTGGNITNVNAVNQTQYNDHLVFHVINHPVVVMNVRFA